EAHVGGLVEAAQLLHGHVADPPARDVALADRLEPVDDPLDARLDVLGLDRPLLQRGQHAGPQLALVERLAPPVALDDVRHHELRRLECREALLALQALAPPAHLPAFAGEPRIDDLRVGVVTERAVHVIKTGDRRPRHWARIPPKKVSDTYFPEIGVRHLFSVA